MLIASIVADNDYDVSADDTDGDDYDDSADDDADDDNHQESSSSG